MIELNDFYNDGFGWICRHCAPRRDKTALPEVPLRLMHEGEGESKSPEFSTLGLARWADPAHRILICPTCGISELADRQ